MARTAAQARAAREKQAKTIRDMHAREARKQVRARDAGGHRIANKPKARQATGGSGSDYVAPRPKRRADGKCDKPWCWTNAGRTVCAQRDCRPKPEPKKAKRPKAKQGKEWMDVQRRLEHEHPEVRAMPLYGKDSVRVGAQKQLVRTGQATQFPGQTARPPQQILDLPFGRGHRGKKAPKRYNPVTGSGVDLVHPALRKRY